MYSETRPRGRADDELGTLVGGDMGDIPSEAALAPTSWPRPLERRILQNTVGDCSRGQAARGQAAAAHRLAGFCRTMTEALEETGSSRGDEAAEADGVEGGTPSPLVSMAS